VRLQLSCAETETNLPLLRSSVVLGLAVPPRDQTQRLDHGRLHQPLVLQRSVPSIALKDNAQAINIGARVDIDRIEFRLLRLMYSSVPTMAPSR